MALGVSAVWLLAPIPGAIGHGQASGAANPALLALAAALGALLPDLDAQRSTIRYLRVDMGRGKRLRPFEPLAALVSRTLGHRGPLHSLLGIGAVWLLLGLPILLWIGWQPSAAFALGMLSHLLGDGCTKLGDGCTKSGVPLLFPRAGRRHLLPPSLRLTTGSLAERRLLALLAVPALLMPLSALLMLLSGIL